MTGAAILAHAGSEATASDLRPLDLQVEGLAKAFVKGKPIFSDVSFSVARGDVVALLGANGAGKSTLLACLVRLIQPDAGRVTLLGQSLTDASEQSLRRARLSVALVFQRHNLVPRASVLTNVVQGLLGREGIRVWSHALARSEVRERAMAALERVGLADLAPRRADRLSGGQSQRVAIARALVSAPRVLLADEPAASLDPSAGDEVMALLMALARESGVTVLYTTHNVNHAMEADRVLGLQHGGLHLDAVTEELGNQRLEQLYGQ